MRSGRDTNEVLLTWLRYCFSAIRRTLVRGRLFLFRSTSNTASRRDFLQGRWWKFRPGSVRSEHPIRFPQPDNTNSTQKQPRSIGGINIEAVAPTNMATRAVRAVPVHRPPGAIEESQFLLGCTKCGDCIEVCPYNALVRAPDRLGSFAGTPIIEADRSACMMCEDFPCIGSCGPGVLIDSIPPIMGTARVTEHLCFAYHDQPCTTCSESCPVGGAINLVEGKPVVDENICTGCGVCRHVCPAAENAILLMPVCVRPQLPRS